MTGQKQPQAVQVTLDREMLRELERRAEAAGISTREMFRLLLIGELAKRPSGVTLH